VRLFNGDTKALINDSQFKAYISIILVAISVLTFWQLAVNHRSFLQALRHSSFHAVSIITSTGFTTQDYTTWGNFPQMIFLLLSIVGGCTGSTSGGIKIFRFQVLFSLTVAHLRQLRRPHGVYIPLYNKQKLSDFMSTSVFTFVTLYCFVLIAISGALSLVGLDITSSISGAAASLGNVGPGLGSQIGPASTYAVLPDSTKMIMMVGMIIGRLELLTVLVLFMPSFWRD
jgi:trk system potassium uptake protein TrkH